MNLENNDKSILVPIFIDIRLGDYQLKDKFEWLVFFFSIEKWNFFLTNQNEGIYVPMNIHLNNFQFNLFQI